MVMATPSPQQVGREFVRQYYTVLHEAPEVLHRFYSSGSTFVHGGIDRPGLAVEPVIGQLDIDKKIRELNFKDCHTKIRQVDSQATIGSGVVVQVTGELSNNGEPMRRFMQTFVLAPQSAKKFYVHNDIFRYQDEVYQDNSESESEETPAADAHHHHQHDEQLLHNNNNHHHEEQVPPPPTTTATTVAVAEKSSNEMNGHAVEPLPQRVKEEKVELFSIETTTTTTTTTNTKDTTVKVSNKEVVKEQSDVAAKSEAQQQPDKSSWAKIIGTRGSDTSAANASQAPATLSFHNHSTQSQTNSTTSIKFGGIANVKEKKASSNGPNKKPASSSSSAKTSQPAGQQRNHQNNNSNSNPNTNNNHQTSATATSTVAAANNNNNNGNNTNNSNNNSGTLDLSGNLDDDKRFGRYPDNQQVFVGNLNQDLTELDLKKIFSDYGRVVEVRINTNTKQQSGRRLPNYGFVVFDDKATVDNLLGSTKSHNIAYTNEKGVEFRLNVEEKRARQGRQSGSNNNNNNSSGKSNHRATRSSSNGSRNGPNTNGTSSKKNVHNNDYINNKKRDVNHDNFIDGGMKTNLTRGS